MLFFLQSSGRFRPFILRDLFLRLLCEMSKKTIEEGDVSSADFFPDGRAPAAMRSLPVVVDLWLCSQVRVSRYSQISLFCFNYKKSSVGYEWTLGLMAGYFGSFLFSPLNRRRLLFLSCSPLDFFALFRLFSVVWVGVKGI